MSVQNSAARCEHRRLALVEPIPGADVVEIGAAPSARRRRRALLAEDPAMRRRPNPPRAEAADASFSLGRMLLGSMAALALGVGGVGVGTLLGPGDYSGPTSVHAVSAGESLWSIAQGVDTERPLEEVVTDIESLNGIEGGLVVGQRIEVPLR